MEKQKAYTPDFLKEMETVLLGEQGRLQSALARITTKKQPNSAADALFPDYGDGEDESAMEVAEFENSLSLEYEIEKNLRDISAALGRISDKTYGIDKYTGELISQDRLRARPTSTTSVESKKTLTQEL